MSITEIHFWSLLAAVLCACSCSVLGTYLVVRRMSLLGDAISHSILPGLALAFLISGSRAPGPMFIGAGIFGILTAFLSQFLAKYCRVDQGAALGVIFTTFFALGVLLIRIAADRVDLDPGCVLYGMLEYTAFDTVEIFGREIPRAISVLAPMLFLIILYVGIFYKELKITAFDPGLASTLGFNVALVNFSFMAAVAAVSVAAFESVGSILVVAMFIIPAATARLLTDRFFMTLTLSVLLGIAAAFLGYDGAIRWNTSVAGAMGVSSGILFFTALLLAPRYGLVAKFFHRLSLQIRVVSEDILGLLFRCQEENYNRSFPLSARNIATALGGGLIPAVGLFQLRARGLISRTADWTYQLKAEGEERARRIVRTHRLWETYLVEQVNINEDHVHATATKLEHFTSREMEQRLAEKTGSPATDPHGKTIPQNGDPGPEKPD